MKIIKWLFGFIIFSFCLILSSEMTQEYFINFTNHFYYIDVNSDDRQQLYQVLSKVSNQNRIPVFCVAKEFPIKQLTDITIYMNSEDVDTFSREFDVRTGRYSSFFSGTTTVSYLDFSEIQYHSNIERFYFQSDSIIQMENIHRQISEHFGTSYVRKETESGLHFILNILWGIPLLFLILLTWFSIQFDRKKDFLRISLGASKIHLIMDSIFKDLFIFILEFMSVFFIFDHFIYIRHHWYVMLISFVSFLILNSIMHLTLFRFQYKEILYGANLNMKLLSNCYLMKAAVLILTIFSVSVNCYLIEGQQRYIKYQNMIIQHQHSSFLQFRPDMQYYRQEANENDVHSNIATTIFQKYAYSNNLDFSFVSEETENAGQSICCLNDCSMIDSKRLQDLIDMNVDFCFLYPTDFPTTYCTSEAVELSIESTFGIDAKTIQYCSVPYNFHANVVYMDNQLTNGFGITQSPAILFCNTKRLTLQEALKNCNDIDPSLFSNSMFHVDSAETTQLKQEFHLIDCCLISASKQFEESKNNMLRIVILNTVISILMIALNFSIGTVIIRLQYVINAKRLAIMKILGHSVLKMNYNIFALNIFSVLIGLITNIILVFMYCKTTIGIVISTGMLFTMMDMIITLYYIQHMERVNTQKVLKGGSL